MAGDFRVAQHRGALLEALFGVMLGQLLSAWVKFTGVAHVCERQRETGPCQQLAQRQRVVIVRSSVIRDDHVGAHRSRDPVSRTHRPHGSRSRR
jgi:hypothetical protein